MVLVDLLGFGFSDKPQSFQYTIAAHAETVAELLTLLDLPPANVYGHSMGGSVAIAAATLARQRVCGLVLSEPNLDSGGGAYSRAIAAQSEDDYVQLGHDHKLSEANASGLLTWAGSMRVASALAVHRSATSLVLGQNPSWREQLNALAIPRTVLFGEHSLPDEDFVTLPRSGVNVDVVKSASHLMVWENPSGLAQCIASAIGVPSAA